MELPSVNIVIGVTGSVAAIKLPLLIEELLKTEGFRPVIQVVSTDHATHFFDEKAINSLPELKLHRDIDEWNTWSKMLDPVLHIELRRWADVLVIAPLDANTMAKLASGICDNLLTCMVRAWDMDKPLLYCPAMNTHMWTHPITDEHLKKLKSLGYIEVPAVAKKLACGDIGMGGMADVLTIANAVRNAFSKGKSG